MFRQRHKLTATLKHHLSGFVIVSFLENISTGLHFKGMEYLYVGYVTAFKRAGNIIISTFLGSMFLHESVTKYIIVLVVDRYCLMNV